MNNTERLLHEAHLRYQRSQLHPKQLTQVGATQGELFPIAELRGLRQREPQSRTWQFQHRDWRPVGYYRIHCSHDRLLWDVCTTCKRDKREASANWGKLMRGDRF